MAETDRLLLKEGLPDDVGTVETLELPVWVADTVTLGEAVSVTVALALCDAVDEADASVDTLLVCEVVSEAVTVIEAGTGTGKTVAYGVSALPLAKALDKRLVIATATIALQEQIVGKDLPDLREESGLDFSFALAKGRRRYLCLSRLDRLLQEHGGQNLLLPLYDDGLRPMVTIRCSMSQCWIVTDVASGMVTGTAGRVNWKPRPGCRSVPTTVSVRGGNVPSTRTACFTGHESRSIGWTVL